MIKRTLFLVIIVSVIIYPQENKLKFLVEPYIQNTSVSGTMILCETNINSECGVRYGKAELNKNEPVLNKNVSGNISEMMHCVELKNLEPGTEYFYQTFVFTNSSDTLWSEILPFRTFPNKNEPLTFAVFSDSQQQDDSLCWKNISEMALMERPNFGLIVGDLVERGSEVYMWRYQFLNHGHEFMKSIPLFGVMGNHDGNDPNYFKYIKTRSSESYYTFTYNNTQFFIVDTDIETEPGSPQYNWLEEALAKSKAEWKIVAHHHPVYTSDNDDYGNSAAALRLKGDPVTLPLVPLYEKYNVDMVFYGHIHSYERTWPILGDSVDEKGIIYVQTGGAGGNLEHTDVIRSWYTAKLKRAHNYCLVSVINNNLHFSAIDYNGNEFDHVELKKDSGKETALSAPVIKANDNKFIDKARVTILNYDPAAEVRYTLDGAEPVKTSALYREPITLNENAVVKACAFKADEKSKTSVMEFQKTSGQKPVSVTPQNNGLKYKYYYGENWRSLPDFTKLKPVKEGATDSIAIGTIKDREDQFAIVYEGYVLIDSSDIYTYYVRSDDGTKLFIDDQLVVDNDGSHSPRTVSGSAALLKGYHKFSLQYFEDSEGEELKVEFRSGKYNRRPLHKSELFY